jgi:hypothetical protein
MVPSTCVKPDVKLPTLFTDCNTCTLTASILQTVHIPPRTIGSPWRSTTLSAMQSRVLSLRLDGEPHSFEEARRSVRYLGGAPQLAGHLHACSPRVISVRKIVTKSMVTLILVDDQASRPVGVIGETIAWDLDGIDVRLMIGRDEVTI